MNLKHALARLAATPLFTIFAVLSLAAGVAVTTAVYSVVDTLLLTDLGIAEPERTAIVATPFSGRAQSATVSHADFEDVKRIQTSFASLTAAAAILPSVAALVSHRTREIGVRMSVGATAHAIKLMVLKDGYRPVIEGLVLGLWGGVAGRIVLRSYMDLEDVTIVDPWMLFLTPMPLVGAAFCACYLPASRAASVDPTVALRSQ